MKVAYENLRFYQEICEIRRKAYKITERFPKGEMRRVSQMRDAIRSAKQNIQEGYKKETAGEFAHSIKISRGSLEEFKGDFTDCLEDDLINKEEFSSLIKLVHSADYLSARYLIALYKLKREGKWKSPHR